MVTRLIASPPCISAKPSLTESVGEHHPRALAPAKALVALNPNVLAGRGCVPQREKVVDLGEETQTGEVI